MWAGLPVRMLFIALFTTVEGWKQSKYTSMWESVLPYIYAKTDFVANKNGIT
jgi:hypothetical protein